MYNREVNQTNLPSKKFLIISGVAIFLLAIVLIVQTEWFKNIFKPKERPGGPIMVGEAITKDSNGNGIPDWEEALWGLDPTVLYTGEMSNREIIENKKKGLGLENIGELNPSQQIARDIITIAMSLGYEGFSNDTIGEIGEELAKNTEITDIPQKYNINNIKTVPTTMNSIKNYNDSLNKILEEAPEDRSGEIITYTLYYEENSRLSELSIYAENYQNIISKISKLEAPVGGARYHVDILNGLNGMSVAFSYLANIDDDFIKATNGFGLLKKYSILFEMSIEEYALFLENYGII